MCCCVRKVSAYNEASSSTETWSDKVITTARTFQQPSDIQLINSTFDSLTVSWTSPSDDSVRQHQLEYSEVGDQLQHLRLRLYSL